MRQIQSVDFSEIEARTHAAMQSMCKVTWCHDRHLPNGRLCFKHEMDYVLKYGRPSLGDVRFSEGRGFINAI